MKVEERWMGRALELARKAGNGARPNPRVGAVVVKAGKVVGEGFHRKAGQPHAEALALQQAGAKAKGADLYVTMEPCSTQGRTPPCTGAIRRAGVRRVIYGSIDVDPRNAVRAERILRQAGIQVTKGVLQEECDRLNEDYFHWKRTRQPWVILKLAITIDGYLALPGKRWVTGKKAREEVQKIRAGCDAILVGAETVRRDNPRLTVRGPFRHSAECRNIPRGQPWRVVVTRSGKLPKTANLFRDRHRDRTLVYRNKSWSSILRDLHQKGVSRLLVEGGAKVTAEMVAAGLVQEVVIHMAPLVLPQGNAYLPRIPDWSLWNWRKVTISGAGQDLCLRGTLKGAN